MDNKYEKASKESADRTDLKYAQQISELLEIDPKKLAKYFPEQTDKDKLVELIKIVNNSTDQNEKIAQIQENISNYAETVISIVKYIKGV